MQPPEKYRSEEQYKRIIAIVGGDADHLDFLDRVQRFHQYLVSKLQLPGLVTGIGPFAWEQRYLNTRNERRYHAASRQTQPSFKDTFALLDVGKGVGAEWMMYPLEDLVAHVRRSPDRREFYLGLSELRTLEDASPNYQPLDDYAVWFMNER